MGGQYHGSQYHMDQFKTSDGKTLLDSQVQNLVSAMAGFAPPVAGETTLTCGLPDGADTGVGGELAVGGLMDCLHALRGGSQSMVTAHAGRHGCTQVLVKIAADHFAMQTIAIYACFTKLQGLFLCK